MTRAVAVLLALFGPIAARAADIPRPEHPEPLSVRDHWTNLNGPWDFRFDPEDKGKDADWSKPGAEGFDQTITVPFPWESELSGIHDTSGDSKIGWYRRTFQVPEDFPANDHVWLHFGAIDYKADIWVNGEHVADHEGGYTPIAVDVTKQVKKDGDNVVVVRAFDPTDPSLPVGKQVGWYTPTSGIWQTVWLEARPETHIDHFKIQTSIDPAEAVFEVRVRDVPAHARSYVVAVRSDEASIEATEEPVNLPRKTLPDTQVKAGVSKIRTTVQNPKLWTPDSPHLYDVTLELKDADGKVVDSVKTYFGLRTIARGKYGDEPFERILLNGKPIYLRGALDQSFNPKGIYTAPSDDFLKQDISDAKKLGMNFLRIHIKPDEPRRLYWADRLGMLIMEDMPNTWRQNEKARKAWEHTMREVIPRDRNHPSIFAWVDFNETWGLNHPEYRSNDDTQQWVQCMVGETRKLDPTRLVEDNSPCNYDHVEGTDINSWHFYIDNPQRPREHIANVVEQTEPGNKFNYVDDMTQSTAPLMNSEYGSVGAGSGDRDVSWGFHDLTTILRSYPKIQGYIYTELSDIEWEHNGFLNYDRSPKDFGYSAFVPNMTPADLQGADFVGYNCEPALTVKPGELIAVPVFVSHYSDRTDAPTLKWWVSGTNDQGKDISIEPRERSVEWTPYNVKAQKRIAFRIHEPFVGAVGLELVDSSGKRIAANYVNVVVQPESPQPRIERQDDHLAIVRFNPQDFSSASWSDNLDFREGKAAGQGSGHFTYKIQLPESVAKAHPTAVRLRLEVSSRAGREKVEWPERKHPQDYPQTDVHKWPSSVSVTLNGSKLAAFELSDDPADARGVLSHLQRKDHGSYGEIVTVEGVLPETTHEDLEKGRPLILRFEVPNADEKAGGLAIYGAHTGAYPFDPTLVVETENDLPENLGSDPSKSLAIDTLASRRSHLLRSGDLAGEKPTSWFYTTDDPGQGWTLPDFDDSMWKSAPGGFGTRNTPAVNVRTEWNTPRIWMRTSIDLPRLGDEDLLTLHLFHDENVEIFVNGKRLFQARGFVTGYEDIPLSAEQKALFLPGKNVIAVTCHQTGGGQGIDLGLGLLKSE